MKHLLKSLVFALVTFTLLLIASCSKDDGPEPKKEEIAEQPKEEPKEEEPKEEESPEESNKITDNVIIKGSTKLEGVLPAPNGAITFDDLTVTVTNGYPNEGFDIPLNSTSDITGAYIQFKANDAAIAESYYDVNITENSAFDKSGKKKVLKNDLRPDTRSLTAKRSFANLDVDLAPEFSPGEFCYLICVYDAAGNISEPQEVCVKINAWGGNDDLVGKWNYTKNERYLIDGTVNSYPVGTERCFDETYVCADESSFEYTGCFTKEEESFDFRSDGTYTHTYRNSGTGLDWDAVAVDCSPVIIETWFAFTISGNWSYNSENKEIIVVEYDQLWESHTGPTETMNAPGDGEVYPFGPVKVEQGILTWGIGPELLGDDLNGDGVVNDDDSGWLNFYKKE